MFAQFNSSRCRTVATTSFRQLCWLTLVIFAMLLSPRFGITQDRTKANVFRAGAATSNITPPLGGSIVGGFLPIPSKHIHDELHARCLVLDDGQTRLALVVCDLLGFHRAVSDEARTQIENRLGIPAGNILISATHTHSAVSALGSDRYKFQIELDEYQQFVVQRIVDGVQRASNLLRPAELGYGSVEVPEHVFNRRWFMKEGTVPANPFGEIDRVKMNPPGGSPNLVEPAGPTDPVVSFISVREPAGDPIGLYAAYSLHYVGGVGSGHVSADYFAMFCRELTRMQQAQHQTPEYVPMMANGTSGNINNINFREPRPRKAAYEQMQYVALDVATKVYDALKQVTYRSDISLAAAYRETEIGWRVPSPEQLDWANKTISKAAPTSGKADLPAIYAQRVLSMADHPAIAAVPLQVLRIGDICISTMPCEIFCEIGLAFRRESTQKPAFMVSLGHGYFGYLPTPEQHQLGGYETWLGTNRMEIEASNKLLDALLTMAAEIAAPSK